MIQTNPAFSSKDPDNKRRQALAKVYSLLIRLAEEAEKLAQATKNPSEQPKVMEPVSVMKNPIIDKDKTVPLQNNIPS